MEYVITSNQEEILLLIYTSYSRAPFLIWMVLVGMKDGAGEYIKFSTKIQALTTPRIFIMESIITVVVSSICFWIIVPFPEKASFLNEDEKRLLLARLEEDGGSIQNDRITFRRVLPMTADWKIWIW